MTDIAFGKELHGMFYSQSYIGLVFENHESGYPYEVMIYDLKGTLAGDFSIETDYKKYGFVEDNVLMYDDNDMLLYGLDGTQRFGHVFDAAIDSLIPVSGDDTYVYINSRKVQKIKLTE